MRVSSETERSIDLLEPSGPLKAGLAVAQRIIDAHRGPIRLDSAPGAGSTFHSSSPAAPAIGR